LLKEDEVLANLLVPALSGSSGAYLQDLEWG